jgi:hypothetical protein
MLKHFPFILSLVLTVVANAAGGEKAFDPAARAKAIAPYVDAQTRLIFLLSASMLVF